MAEGRSYGIHSRQPSNGDEMENLDVISGQADFTREIWMISVEMERAVCRD